MLKRSALVLSLGALLLASCGKPIGTSSAPSPSHASTVTPSTAASPTSNTYPLFAVLEVRRSGAPAGSQGFSDDTLAIALLDGYAKARASFTPRSIPKVFDASPVLEPEAYVAAGAAYYIDGKGVVRRLEPSGATTIAATFALTSPQQTASFAVSPDGRRLMAAVLTFPTYTVSQSAFGVTQTSPWMLSVESAPAGGSTTVLRTWRGNRIAFPGAPGDFPDIRVVGWDATGPLALVGDGVETQNAWLDGMRFFNGQLQRLSEDGQLGPVLVGSDCQPFAPPVANKVICVSSSVTASVAIRTTAGNTIWTGSVQVPNVSSPGDYVLSGDGSQLAMRGQVVNLAAANPSMTLPAAFAPQGWLDETTVIGTLGSFRDYPAPPMGVVHLTSPSQVEDWGFSGLFIGTL